MAKVVSKRIANGIANAQTLAELKGAYLDAMLGHTTQSLLDQYDAMYIAKFDEVKNVARRKDGTLYEWEVEETCAVFLNAVHHIKELDGVEAHMDRDWLWVTGDCKPVAERLKAGAGLRYSANRQAWYLPDSKIFNKRG